MTDLLLGLGLVFVIEGLVLALAPLRLQQLLETFAKMPPEQRRLFGLIAMAFGVGVVALVRGSGG